MMILYQYYCKNCGYKREGLLDSPAIGIDSYSTYCPECNGTYDSYVVNEDDDERQNL
jgi:predicted nucleic acid-binding Zn ribbon protein